MKDHLAHRWWLRVALVGLALVLAWSQWAADPGANLFVAAWAAAAVVGPMNRAPRFIPAGEHLNGATLPSAVSVDPGELPAGEPEAWLESGGGDVRVGRWDPEDRALDVNLRQADRLMVRTFNFPGWTATVNGRPAEIIGGGDFNRIALDLPPGAHLGLRRALGAFLAGALVFYNSLHVVTHGFSRYRLPVMPIVFMLAAAGWLLVVLSFFVELPSYH